MISPTSRGIRDNDKWGSGRYGASRGDRKHKGTDYICRPGQEIKSPINGKIVRESKPYPGSFSGLLIKGNHLTIKMFYFMPFDALIGERVQKGQLIGTAQDISKKYPGMIPHIHLEVISVDPELFTEYL
jgi:murein DD-endopeptidase MepM/ murein hydrolase activator NlpD